MDSLRQRANLIDKPAGDDDMESILAKPEKGQFGSMSWTERFGKQWLYAPALVILTTLLLATLYVLRTEQSQVIGQQDTIRELKTQIRALRQEVLGAKSIGQCSSGSVTKLQDEVHKLERVAENLKAGKQEADKQLQEMISRVSLLQSERNKLKTALRAMKQELNESGEDEGRADQ